MLLICISWIILKFPGVDEMVIGEALIRFESAPPTWNDLAVAEIASLKDGFGVTSCKISFPANL